MGTFFRLPALRGQRGTTLLEVSVGMLVLAVGVSGLIGATGIAQIATTSRDNSSSTTVEVVSQLEAVAAHPSQSSYPVVVSPTSPDRALQVDVEEVRPNLLQRVQVSALFRGVVTEQIEAYKARRFLETGLAPSASGIERLCLLPPVPSLGSLEGYFRVVEQLPSALPADLFVHWRWSELSTSDRAILAIYEGQPFGTATSGTSSTHPLTVPASLVALGEFATGTLAVAVIAQDTSAGDYTVYLFNNHHGNKSLVTHSAEVGGICRLPA